MSWVDWLLILPGAGQLDFFLGSLKIANSLAHRSTHHGPRAHRPRYGHADHRKRSYLRAALWLRYGGGEWRTCLFARAVQPDGISNRTGSDLSLVGLRVGRGDGRLSVRSLRTPPGADAEWSALRRLCHRRGPANGSLAISSSAPGGWSRHRLRIAGRSPLYRRDLAGGNPREADLRLPVGHRDWHPGGLCQQLLRRPAWPIKLALDVWPGRHYPPSFFAWRFSGSRRARDG